MNKRELKKEVDEIVDHFAKAILQLVINGLIFFFCENDYVLLINGLLTVFSLGGLYGAFFELDLLKMDLLYHKFE